jgi:uncharacterized membrane protein/predicted DsbA family dithiol-disulfide isomerase
MRSSPARHRVALAIALIGVALSAVSLLVHQWVAAGTGYTSFCNFGEVANCDAVLASRYGTVLGVPVAGWGLLAFVAGALLALPGARGHVVGLADLLLLGLVSASLGFALVLAVVSVFILHHLCMLCLATDAVILAWFAAVAPLARRFEPGSHGGWWRRRAAAHAMAAAGLVLAVAGGTWAAAWAPAPARTLADVRERDPKFYEWYTRLPVRPSEVLITPGCHLKGPPDAAVAIVEFSDFQCPFCVEAYRDLRDLLRNRSDVSLVFRHYPLDASCNSNVKRSLHPDACLAACAAECAGKQGRFWEYHDVLFDNHESLERESLFRYAREMQLDLTAFRICLDDPATQERVGEDVRAGARAGVGSTPTIFINGRKVEGALDRAYYDYALIIERHAREAHSPAGAS